MKVVMKKVADLVPNELKQYLFETNHDKESFLELKASIALGGVQVPLITYGRNVRKGNRRLQCCIDLGIKTVPCIDEKYNSELESLLVDSKSQLTDNYKTFILDSFKKQTVLAKLLRLETLNETYNIRQGARTDLNGRIAMYIMERNAIASTSTRTHLLQLRKHLEKAMPGQRDVQNEWIKQQGGSAKLKTLLIDARRLAASINVNQKNADASSIQQRKNCLRQRTDYCNGSITIYNQSCFDLTVIHDRTIQVIVGSPPYPQARPKQDGIDNSQEIGTEPDVETYTDRLVECYTRCKSKLTEDGTIWVNIADNMRDGSFKGAPELFLTKMLRAGFKCCDKIYWVKTSAQPGDGDNSFQNVEYIMKFSVCDRPYTNYAWLNDTDNFNGNTFGKGKRIKISSFINLKQGFITTSPASTAKLRKACEEAGFYLEHTSTYLPEIPYMCIKLSSKINSNILDIFNGCGNTAVAVLEAEMNLSYYGIEINGQSVKASQINLEKVHKLLPKGDVVDFIPDSVSCQQKAA